MFTTRNSGAVAGKNWRSSLTETYRQSSLYNIMASSQGQSSIRSTVEDGTGRSIGTNSSLSTLASSLPSEVLCAADENQKALFNTMVGQVVRDVVFPKKQFIVLERELESNSKLATKCLKALRMNKSKWDLVKDPIRKGLKSKRNNAQLNVRRNLRRKWPTRQSFFQFL